MNFEEYQMKANQTVEYPQAGQNLIYPAMGLAGEAGECCDKIKKLWRNKGVGLLTQFDISSEEHAEIVKELGDVLWYISAIASEMRVPLDVVAAQNIKKLMSRKERGVLKSQGDNR